MLDRRMRVFLTLALLTACQGVAPGRATHAIKAGIAAATTSDLAPTPSPTASVLPASLLKPPGSQHLTLSGEVRVDASYAAASHHGQASGGTLAIGGTPGASAGGNVISDHGAGIISDHGAGVVSNNGGGLLSQSASQLLGFADNGLLANNGAGVLANNGGSLIGKAKRALLQAAEALLPAAGMVVFVLDLRTGNPLPVGLDENGREVYSVYTDARGHYQLFLDLVQSPNVRVVAVPPTLDDPRLVYNLLVAPATQQAQDLDELTALATRFVRGTLEAYLTDRVVTHRDFGLGASPEPSAAPDTLGPLLADYLDALEKAGLRTLAPLHVHAVTQAVADAVSAFADFNALQTDNHNTSWTGPAEPALPVIAGFIQAVTHAAATRLAADPHAFDQRPWMLAANRHRAAEGLPPYQIARAADLGELIFHEYLDSVDKTQHYRLHYVVHDLGLDVASVEHLYAAYQGIFEGLAELMIANQDVKAAAIAAISRSSAVERARQQAETTTPMPSSSPGAADAGWQVQTIVGSDAGYADGAGSKARLSSPGGLVYDGDHTLYVADANNLAIRAVDLATPGYPVVTIAGAHGIGHVDGKAAVARFAGLQQLAFDGGASPPCLYVSEAQNADIRKITLGADVEVTTLAGSTAGGDGDGPGASVRFQHPSGLALDGAGQLYVAEPDANRIRRIDLVDPAHPVTTVVGPHATEQEAVGDAPVAYGDAPVNLLADGQGGLLVLRYAGLDRLVPSPQPVVTALAGGASGHVDGLWLDVRMSNATALARGPAGRLYVVENGNSDVRVATPAGPDALEVETLAGPQPPAEGITGFVDGPASMARFAGLDGVAVDAKGNLYVSDTGNNRIRMLSRP